MQQQILQIAKDTQEIARRMQQTLEARSWERNFSHSNQNKKILTVSTGIGHQQECQKIIGFPFAEASPNGALLFGMRDTMLIDTSGKIETSQRVFFHNATFTSKEQLDKFQNHTRNSQKIELEIQSTPQLHDIRIQSYAVTMKEWKGKAREEQPLEDHDIFTKLPDLGRRSSRGPSKGKEPR
jgi:hypothetical protein